MSNGLKLLNSPYKQNNQPKTVVLILHGQGKVRCNNENRYVRAVSEIASANMSLSGMRNFNREIMYIRGLFNYYLHLIYVSQTKRK